MTGEDLPLGVITEKLHAVATAVYYESSAPRTTETTILVPTTDAHPGPIPSEHSNDATGYVLAAALAIAAIGLTIAGARHRR